MDKQAPIFKEPEVDLNQKLELHFPADSCTVYGEHPFTEYEEQAGFNADHSPLATDNCDSEVEVVRKLFDDTGKVIYDSSVPSDAFPDLSGPGTWKMCYIAIDDYMKTMTGIHAFKTWTPQGDCPSACRFCSAGNPEGGGVDLVDGVCNKWCSPLEKCGTSDVHKAGADCRKCVGHSDNSWMVNKAEHCVDLKLSDITPPYDYAGCPEDIYVEIDAHLNSTTVDWTPPTISGDNCEAHGTVPDAMEQSDPPKFPGMSFPVGAHVVNYAVEDAFGNVLEDEECTFTVEVKQKAHPVHVVCPADVIMTTLEDASFAIVTWERPVATQGGKILDATHITYPQGVEPGLPFPFGTTTILVHARGEITGERVDEHLMFDECIFNVTVEDPQRPEVDGRLYRCMESELDQSKYAMPFRVCNGTDLEWIPHPEYIHTHGFDIMGTHQTSLECCTSEEGVEHVCTKVTTPVNVEPLVSYCKPKH